MLSIRSFSAIIAVLFIFGILGTSFNVCVVKSEDVSTIQDIYLTAILVVDGIIQTDDPWTIGEIEYNEWAKPMYYISLDDNGDPSDGAHGNGEGPKSCIIQLDTGRHNFLWFGPDRKWNTEDDVKYSPIEEIESGRWSGNGVESRIIQGGKALNVTFPLSLIGSPSTLEVSFMVSPWTSAAMDNLGEGHASPLAWIVIPDTSVTQDYHQADSKGDTGDWSINLNPSRKENFDIVEAQVFIRTIQPKPTPQPPQPPSPEGIPLEYLAIIGVVVIVILVIVVFMMRRKVAEEHYQLSVPSRPTPPIQATKFCADCGTPIKPGYKFCENCGRKI